MLTVGHQGGLKTMERRHYFVLGILDNTTELSLTEAHLST